MDANQRLQIAAQISSAREQRGWPKERLAEEAGLSVNTVRALEKGSVVRPGSLGKALETLEIEPLAEVVERATDPADVHMAVEVVRIWLLGMPQDERPAAVLDLISHIARPQR